MKTLAPPTLRRLACAATLALAAVSIAGADSGKDPSLKRTAYVESPDAIGVGRMLPDLAFTSLDKAEHSLAALAKTRKATVICATSVTCPLSIRYGPKLATLAREYATRDVQFILLNVSDTDSVADMREQANRLGWAGLSLADASREIRATLGIRTTTEVFVIDAARTLVYRGAVDDQYGIGSALPAPRSPWLRQALDALLADRRVEAAATWPPGCVVETPATARKVEVPVTYHSRISRIVQNRCLDCHRRDGGAPFRLDTYEDVAGRAAMIKSLVADGLMPPWHAAPVEEGELSPWSNDRSLPTSERADLLAWIEAERSLGEQSDAPLTRRFPAMWTIQQPSLTLTSPSMSIPAEGALRYAPIVLPTNLKEDRWLSAIELRPMSHGIFHHAMIYLLPLDPEVTAPEDISRDFVAQFGMGDSVVAFTPGTARRIPAGARLLVHAYFLSGQKSVSERFSVGMKFTDEPLLAQVEMRAPGIESLIIPAGAASHEIIATTTLERETLVSAFSPVMAARGKSIRYDAILPDGTTRTLLDVPEYDYRWRERYVLRDPVALPAGTRLQIRAVFDNSAGNPNNPFPMREAGWGWGIEHEILLGFFETLTAR